MTHHGERHHSAKLTADDVRAIRAMYSDIDAPSYSQLGAQFGVSHVAIHKIVKRQSWKHVED